MFIFMKSRPCLKQSHAGLKPRLVCQILEKHGVHVARMSISIKSRSDSELGHVGSKTRSLGQILEKQKAQF